MIRRAEMVSRLLNLGVHVADVAAAELAKDCAGCKHWSFVQFPGHGGMPKCMGQPHRDSMPEDGSGYCRPGWEAKP